MRQGQARFGSADARVTSALEPITDVEWLEELSVQLLDAKSWEELLGLPKPRRSPARHRPKA